MESLSRSTKIRELLILGSVLNAIPRECIFTEINEYSRSIYVTIQFNKLQVSSFNKDYNVLKVLEWK